MSGDGIVCKPFPDNKILNMFNLKAFADERLNCAERNDFRLVNSKTHCRKKKKIHIPVFFFLFLYQFQKPSTTRF